MVSKKDKSGLMVKATTAAITTPAATVHSDGVVDDSDLLFGASAITDFVNQLSSSRINRRQIYHWLEAGHLPSGRLGAKVVGSKSVIRAHFARLTGG
jgi:hypothetical protein